MGKKSKRNKNNGGGVLRNGLAAAPTAATTATATTIVQTICRLMKARKFDEVLRVESKYRHLDTFSNYPFQDAYVLYAFGTAKNHARSKDETCSERAIHYYERAKERMEVVNANDQHQQQKEIKSDIGMSLAGLYLEGGDVEKAISSHRWHLEHCPRHNVTVMWYVIRLSRNFNRFEKFEYTLEVLEGSMDMMETLEQKAQAEIYLINAYIGCGEFLKAKSANEARISIDRWKAGMQSGRIEEGMCNYKAAIAHFRDVVAGLQKEEYDDGLFSNDSLFSTRFVCSLGLAKNLLRHSAANEDEAFAMFREILDLCVHPTDRDIVLTDMGIEYRKLHKWDQSIQALRQLLCLSSTRPDAEMLPQAQEAIAQTYLEQYCTDTSLDIDQRGEILCRATMQSSRIHFVTTEMHLISAQLSYFNGNKHWAYRYLELYLDARLAECKLSCYCCKQRVRHGSVPFSCASCRVASYCGRKHQKMTWKNERICHKVLCPLFGYWRMAKKRKTRRESNGERDEDRSEYVRVFETFFESICPHVVCRLKQILLLDCEGFRRL